MLRIFGIKAAKVPLFFVVLGYCLRPSIARRGSYYLKHRFRKDRGRLRFIARIFRLYWAFGCILLERAASGILHKFSITPEHDCLVRLQALIADGKGVIMVSAHVGAWQIALAGLHFGVKVNIMQPRDGRDMDLHVFEHQAGVPAGTFHIINPYSGFGGFVDMLAALRRGEVVCLMADRLMPQEKITISCDFLGAPAVFPGSPYVLASITGAPVAVVFSRRNGECAVECKCSAVFNVPPRIGKSEAALQPFVKLFAAALEDYVVAEPYQFFNFHNIWQTEGQYDV